MIRSLGIGAPRAAGVTAAVAGAGGVVPFAFAAAVTGLVAADGGGYWPTSWGWATLLLCSAAAVGLALGGERPSVLELVWVGGLLAVCGWTAASLLWTTSRTQSAHEVQRSLVYASLALATVAVVRRWGATAVVAGAWAGATTVCLYALAYRLAPDRIGAGETLAGYRLATPIGYWNGLGLVAAVTAVLAVGLVVEGRSLPLRALAGASLPVLFPTLYFTFSRGAWVALAAALVVVCCLSSRRLSFVTSLVVLGAPAAASVYLAYDARALRATTATSAQAVAAGHELTWKLALLAGGAALAATCWALATPRIRVPAVVRYAYGGAIAVAAVGALAVVVAHYGGPSSALSRARHAIDAAAPGENGDLSHRLLSLSSNGRLEQWHVAVREWRAHPAVGSGAGTYEQYWMAAAGDSKVTDVHNLYLETLAELGIVGLAFLAATLLAPLVGAVRARAVPLVAVAAGAYVAWLVDVVYEWQWELPAVTILAFVCAGALLAAGRHGDRQATRTVTAALVAATAVVGTVGTVGLLANRALAQSAHAASSGAYAKALDDARWARTLAPWSSEPWAQIGVIRLRQGRHAEALAAYRRAVAKDPRDWTLWLAVATLSRGRERAAAVARLQALDPTVASAFSPGAG